MFVGGSWFQVAKHITCLPSLHHRYNVLATKFALRSTCLPDDCLLVLLKHSLQHPRLVKVLEQNPVYCSLPDPIPAVVFQLLFSMYNSIETNKLFISICATHGHSILSNQN
jgi:hypothetical protein